MGHIFIRYNPDNLETWRWHEQTKQGKQRMDFDENIIVKVDEDEGSPLRNGANYLFSPPPKKRGPG